MARPSHLILQPFQCLTVLLMAALLISCSSEERQTPATRNTANTNAATNPSVTVGVSLLTRTHSFYQDLEAAMLAEAKKNNYDLIITAGEFDVAKQKDQIADFIVKKVDAIILAPCDSRSIGTSITDANKAGIPVFTVDISSLAEGADVVAHVATDNYAGGKLAAETMIEALGGGGKVAIIDHPEVESVIERVRGFEEVMAEADGVTIAAKLPGGGVKDRAFKASEDLLQAHPDLNGIFGINDDSALGALAAVEKAGKQGKVVIIGFDAVPEARKAIAEKRLFADVAQKPDEIGRTAIQTLASFMAGETVPPQVLIPCELVTAENAESAAP